MKTLSQLKKEIKKEIPFVNIKPFSHNIISMGLRIVADEYGKEEANKIVRDFNLSRIGYEEA